MTVAHGKAEVTYYRSFVPIWTKSASGGGTTGEKSAESATRGPTTQRSWAALHQRKYTLFEHWKSGAGGAC